MSWAPCCGWSYTNTSAWSSKVKNKSCPWLPWSWSWQVLAYTFHRNSHVKFLFCVWIPLHFLPRTRTYGGWVLLGGAYFCALGCMLDKEQHKRVYANLIQNHDSLHKHLKVIISRIQKQNKKKTKNNDWIGSQTKPEIVRQPSKIIRKLNINISNASALTLELVLGIKWKTFLKIG